MCWGEAGDVEGPFQEKVLTGNTARAVTDGGEGGGSKERQRKGLSVPLPAPELFLIARVTCGGKLASCLPHHLPAPCI